MRAVDRCGRSLRFSAKLLRKLRGKACAGEREVNTSESTPKIEALKWPTRCERARIQSPALRCLAPKRAMVALRYWNITSQTSFSLFAAHYHRGEWRSGISYQPGENGNTWTRYLTTARALFGDDCRLSRLLPHSFWSLFLLICFLAAKTSQRLLEGGGEGFAFSLLSSWSVPRADPG